MEKKITKLSLILFAFFATGSPMAVQAQCVPTNANVGVFESYVVINASGGGNQFYDLQSATANPDFNGASLGTFNCNGSLVIAGGENKTFKCSGCNVTGSTLNYRVYATGSPLGSFIGVNLPFSANLPGGCGGDQRWQNTTNTTNIITGLNAGNYTVEVYSEAPFDGCGTGTCYASNGGANYIATFVVGPAPAAVVSPSTGTLTCTTTSIVLTASGGTSYLWDNSSTDAARTVAAAGTYSVTVTDAATGCSATAQTVIVSNTTSPAVSATASPASICVGNSSILTGSGATTYSWMPGSLTGTTVSVSPVTTTTYTVTGTDASNGCTATSTVAVTVTINPIIVTSMKSDAVASSLAGAAGLITTPVADATGTAGITTQPAGCTYLWSPGGQTTNYIQNQTPGTYQVTITAPGGCTKIQTIIIN